MLRKCAADNCDRPVWDPDYICYECKRDRIYAVALISIYLTTIVAANLIVWHFGQIALLATAGILLPCDFLIRDILHHQWERRGEVAERMAVLIASGSILTLLVNGSAFWVAIASATAFATSGIIDATIYAGMKAFGRFERMTTSNAFGAALDSIAFPLIAFGGFDWKLSASQAAIKFFGGVIIAAIFVHYRKPPNAQLH